MLSIGNYLMNFVLFQTKLKRSSIDEKILLVEGAKATLEEEADIIGEMYVSIFTFVTNVYTYHLRF